MALPKQHRLRSHPSFSRVHRLGRRKSGRCLAVKALLAQPAAVSPPPTQFGIAVSRKVSKKAVERNRIRRQIQAALITLSPRLVEGAQVVISVRPVGVECQYREFLRELEQLLSALEVLEVMNGHS